MDYEEPCPLVLEEIKKILDDKKEGLQFIVVINKTYEIARSKGFFSKLKPWMCEEDFEKLAKTLNVKCE